MQTIIRAVAVASLALLGVAAQAAAQADFHWSGQLSPGQTIEIKGINGDVHATSATGGSAEVMATKTSRRGDPDARAASRFARSTRAKPVARRAPASRVPAAVRPSTATTRR